MNELDTLLSEATINLDNVERARRKLRRYNVGEEESSALRLFLREFDAKHSWKSTSLILLVQRQTCSCGSTHEFTQGQYLRQSHLRIHHTTRLVANNWPNCTLPRSIEYLDSATDLCTSCAGEGGWK